MFPTQQHVIVQPTASLGVAFNVQDGIDMYSQHETSDDIVDVFEGLNMYAGRKALEEKQQTWERAFEALCALEVRYKETVLENELIKPVVRRYLKAAVEVKRRFLKAAILVHVDDGADNEETDIRAPAFDMQASLQTRVPTPPTYAIVTGVARRQQEHTARLLERVKKAAVNNRVDTAMETEDDDVQDAVDVMQMLTMSDNEHEQDEDEEEEDNEGSEDDDGPDFETMVMNIATAAMNQIQNKDAATRFWTEIERTSERLVSTQNELTEAKGRLEAANEAIADSKGVEDGLREMRRTVNASHAHAAFVNETLTDMGNPFASDSVLEHPATGFLVQRGRSVLNLNDEMRGLLNHVNDIVMISTAKTEKIRVKTAVEVQELENDAKTYEQHLEAIIHNANHWTRAV